MTAPEAASPPPAAGRAPEPAPAGPSVADVIAALGSGRVLEVGTGNTALVDALRERGIEAFAASPVALLQTLDASYDRIVCTADLDALGDAESRRAVATLCLGTADVLIAADGRGGAAPSRGRWVTLFAEHGFVPDVDFEAGALGARAMRFRAMPATATLASQLAKARAAAEAKDRQIAELTFRLIAMQATIGWKTLERLRGLRERLLPAGSRRQTAYWTARRLVEVLLDEGLRSLTRKTRHKLRQAARGRGRLLSLPAALARRDLDSQYQRWLQRHRLTTAELLRMREAASQLAVTPRISMLTPVYDPDEPWLRAAIESVRDQVYPHWELCLVNDASTRPYVRAVLDEYAAADPRIRVRHLRDNLGIAGASAEALAMATGEFVGLLDHDDELSPDALYEVVGRLSAEPALDLVYSDEDKINRAGQRVEPFFKPDWSPDLLLSMNYITHFSIFRRSLLLAMGGFRPGFDGSQDYDVLLRFTERTTRIAHVPKVLYHWRKVRGSAAMSSAAKPWAYDAGRRAVEEALRRRGRDASVAMTVPGCYVARYPITGHPFVSIIVATRDRCQLLRQCLASLEESTTYPNYEILVVDNDSVEPETLDYLASLGGRCRVLRHPGPFNFAAINNVASIQAKGDHLLFLNNDTQVVTGDWLDAMLEHAQRPEVGAVGAKLLYPDGRIQHAGLVLGVGAVAGHAFKHLPDGDANYFHLADVVRNCSAVTGACLLVPRAVFEAVGRFDERFSVALNDVDLCLRIRERGHLVVYTPFAVLYHHESATRGRLHLPEEEALFLTRWAATLDRGDPYYNPNLTTADEAWGLRE